MDAGLPDAGRLAWWLTAWLRGDAAADDALEAVTGEDAAHRVAGLPGLDGPVGWALAVGALRAAGAREAGEAVVLGPLLPGQDGWGLVPERVGRGVLWTAYPARRRQVPDVGEADRELRRALTLGATALADLDVARWRPEVADDLVDLRRTATAEPVPGVPPRCVELAGRALRVLGIVELALADDGGARTSYDVVARRAALDPLARAGRRGLVAACSPEAWPR